MVKVSVIMAIYNCEDTLREAIDSILKQTYTNWELIICDDGSSDRSYDIALSYKNDYPDKFIVLKNDTNRRIAFTLNHCLEYVTGEFVARMDGDDISLKTRFELQVDYLMNNNDCDLIGGNMIPFDENGDNGIRKTNQSPSKYDLIYGAPFAHATIMARKAVYEKLKGYTVSDEIRRCEDLDLWFRFFANGFNGKNLDVPIYKVRECQSDFYRRTFSNGYQAYKVNLKGFRLLGFKKRFYILLLKPLIASVIPGFVMKAYHNFKDRN